VKNSQCHGLNRDASIPNPVIDERRPDLNIPVIGMTAALLKRRNFRFKGRQALISESDQAQRCPLYQAKHYQ
jgi:hypothetical protein